MSTNSRASTSKNPLPDSPSHPQKVFIKPAPIRERSMTSEQITTRFEFDQPTFILATLSTLISLVYLVMAMLDLGRLSYYLGPPIAFLTIVYYITLYILFRVHRARRRRNLGSPKRCPPAFTLSSILFASMLFISWLEPLLVTIWSGANRGEFLPGMGRLFIKGNLGILAVEVILIGVNMLFIGIVTFFCLMGRRQFLQSQRSSSQLLGSKSHHGHREKEASETTVTSVSSQA
jgi:hypothetical protein